MFESIFSRHWNLMILNKARVNILYTTFWQAFPNQSFLFLPLWYDLRGWLGDKTQLYILIPFRMENLVLVGLCWMVAYITEHLDAFASGIAALTRSATAVTALVTCSMAGKNLLVIVVIKVLKKMPSSVSSTMAIFVSLSACSLDMLLLFIRRSTRGSTRSPTSLVRESLK